MCLRQLNKICLQRPMVKYRLFSTTRLLSNSVGYGDLWDDEHNCPDHGHFKGAPNQTWAGENISMATESYVKNIADDYDGTLADVDASLRRDNARVILEHFLLLALVYICMLTLHSVAIIVDKEEKYTYS